MRPFVNCGSGQRKPRDGAVHCKAPAALLSAILRTFTAVLPIEGQGTGDLKLCRAAVQGTAVTNLGRSLVHSGGGRLRLVCCSRPGILRGTPALSRASLQRCLCLLCYAVMSHLVVVACTPQQAQASIETGAIRRACKAQVI
jgi:hypothetical protein